MKLIILLLVFLLVPVAIAFPVYEPFAGSQFKYSNGSLIRLGSLQVEVFDASSGTGYVYAHNFTNRIINGTFSAVLGLDSNELELTQGRTYYYDIRINGIDQDFQDNTGSSLERLPFTASRGNASGFASCGANAVSFFNLTTGNYTCVSAAGFDASELTSNVSKVNASVVALSQTTSNISALNTTFSAWKVAIDSNLTGLNATLVAYASLINGLTVNLTNINASIQGISTGPVTANLTNVNASLQTTKNDVASATANLTNLNASKLDAVPVVNFTTSIGSISKYFSLLYIGDIYLNNSFGLYNFTAQTSSNISAINSTVGTHTTQIAGITANLSNVNLSVVALSQSASNISGLNSSYNTLVGAVIANMTNINASIQGFSTGPVVANLTNINASLQTAFTGLSSLTANLTAVNASVQLISTGALTANLSNVNLSVVALSQTASNLSGINSTVVLINRSLDAKLNQSIIGNITTSGNITPTINFTNFFGSRNMYWNSIYTGYLWLNTTELMNFTIGATSNISAINTTVGTHTTLLNGLAANSSNINLSVVALSQTASNISGINASIQGFSTGPVTANLTNLNASDVLAHTRVGGATANITNLNSTVNSWKTAIDLNLTLLNRTKIQNMSIVNFTQAYIFSNITLPDNESICLNGSNTAGGCNAFIRYNSNCTQIKGPTSQIMVC